MIDALLNFDLTLFRLINQGLSNAVFDAILPWCREKLVWAPLYLFVIAYFIENHGKKAYFILLCLATTVILADVTSSHLIKKNIRRIRPCQDIAIKDEVILRVHCSSGYSFTSSHAANHMALACFFVFFFGRKARWIAPSALTWAGLVAFAQVYVGVHYPLDVLAGALVGLCAAMIVKSIAGRYIFEDH